LTPNGHFSGRTAPLTYRCCILYIYSTNIRTEYFKHAAHTPFFSSSKCRLFHNATFFGSCIIHILYTGCAKILKKIRRQRVNTPSQALILSRFASLLSTWKAVRYNTPYLRKQTPLAELPALKNVTLLEALAMLAMLARAYKAIKFDFRISWHQIARGMSLEARLKNRCG
jgi:hypothetical protein